MRSSRWNSLLSIISMMYRFNSMKRMSSRLLTSSLRVSSNSSISSFGMGSVGSSSLGRWRTFLISASSEALSESPLNKSIDELKKQYRITASSIPRINTLSRSCATNTFTPPRPVWCRRQWTHAPSLPGQTPAQSWVFCNN